MGSLKGLVGLGEADRVNVVVEHKVLLEEDERIVVGQVAAVELGMDLYGCAAAILVAQRLHLLLGVPLAAAHLEIGRCLLVFVDTVGRRQDNARRNQRTARHVQVGRRDIVEENCAHVWPLAKLGLPVFETSDAGPDAVDVAHPAPRLVHLLGRRRWDKVRVLAAHVEKSLALAVLGTEADADVD